MVYDAAGSFLNKKGVIGKPEILEESYLQEDIWK